MEKQAIPGGHFQEDGHQYFDTRGSRVLSVTQVLAMCGLVDYTFVKQSVLEWKSTLGIAVHRGVELMVQHDIDWDTIQDAVMGFIVGADTWMRTMEFVSLSQEQCGVHSLYGMSYGYRYDHLGTMMYKGRKRHAILDLKCTSNASPAWQLQTAGYELPAPALPNGEQYVRVALQLFDNSKFKPYYYDDPNDKRIFMGLLAGAIWKKNHNYEVPEELDGDSGNSPNTHND